MIGVLADHPDDGSTAEREAWSRRLETSLASESGWWVDRVGSTGSQDLSTSEAWVLLGWVETAASRIGTEGRADLVERVAFILALREAGPLDRRDRSVVASPVRRAAEVRGLEFEDLVETGCDRAGALGRACLDWLLEESPEVPLTHRKVPTGSGGVAFVRESASRDGVATRPLDDRPNASAPSSGAAPRVGRTGPLRLTLLVAGSVAVVAVVVVLRDRGVLPVAGPAVAVLATPWLLTGAAWWSDRRVRRAARLGPGLAALVRSLEDGSGRCTRSADGVDRASSRLLHALRRRDRAHRRGPRDEQQNKQG
ncbi:hypothetical protein GCM10009821_09020 [Aeromicrobium halocynthiae]|uniref:DUF2207 domain-containing protein n=1 Tax=Aeromicrobium halocynthiae TaxID=560557 RepID=A0ABN2VUM0_9ACTN